MLKGGSTSTGTLLLWMNVRARGLSKVPDSGLTITTIILFLLFVPQLVLGTEVRSTIDMLLVSDNARTTWSSFLSNSFYIHRSYSWLILIGSGVIFYLVRKRNYQLLKVPSYLLLGSVILIAIVGVIMVEFGFPAWAQPLHLILAAGIFSTVFYLILRLKLA